MVYSAIYGRYAEMECNESLYGWWRESGQYDESNIFCRENFPYGYIRRLWGKYVERFFIKIQVLMENFKFRERLTCPAEVIIIE